METADISDYNFKKTWSFSFAHFKTLELKKKQLVERKKYTLFHQI